MAPTTSSPTFATWEPSSAGRGRVGRASATIATLDATCVGAFGAIWPWRRFARRQANVTLNISQLRFIATFQGAAPPVGAFFQGNINPVQLQQWFGTGTFQVACIRLTP